MSADSGGDILMTSSGLFVVPAGVTSICIAAVPGTSISKLTDASNNIILAAGTGFTSSTFTSSGSSTIPQGVTSLSLTGKGGNGTASYSPPTYTTTYAWHLSSLTYHSTSPSPLYPINYINPPPRNPAYNLENVSYPAFSTPVHGGYDNFTGMGWSGSITQTQTSPGGYVYTTGANTSANINSQNYVFSGGYGGAATATTSSVTIPGTSAQTLSYTIGSPNGSIYYQYQPYAVNKTSSMTGSSTYNIQSNIVAGGPYTGGIAAWRNNYAVVAGQTYTITIAPGGAVRVIWGDGRSFPSNAP